MAMSSSRQPVKWSAEQWKSWRAAPRMSGLLKAATPAGGEAAVPLVVLKVPLSDAYEEQLEEGEAFSVSMFVERMIAKVVGCMRCRAPRGESRSIRIRTIAISRSAMP